MSSGKILGLSKCQIVSADKRHSVLSVFTAVPQSGHLLAWIIMYISLRYWSFYMVIQSHTN